MSTLPAVPLVLGWLAGLPLSTAEGVLIECPAVAYQSIMLA